jgi:hypothetical protein
MAIGTLLRHIIQGKQENCEACESTFSCGPLGACWCGKEKVPPETLQQLKKKYSRCLCPECLRKAISTDSNG